MSGARSSLASFVLGVAALATQAIASTYVVDQSGGGQFTDIPPAIAAAQPGDVLLVMHGSYSAFTLDKGLTIIGYGNPTVAGTAAVSSVPLGQTAVLSSLAPTDLSIAGCLGPVIVQNLGVIHFADVQNSRDVRLRGIRINGFGPLPLNPGGEADSSRLEIVGGNARGNDGSCGFGSIPPVDATPGWRFLASRVQFALSIATGGDGPYCPSPAIGCNGGDGINVGENTTLILTGGGASVLSGGLQGGDSPPGGDCHDNGQSGAAVNCSQGHLFHSGAELQCSEGFFGHTCIEESCDRILGTGTLVSPDDPTLELVGDPIAGQSLVFLLRAPVGSSAILYFGRDAIVVPTPNTAVEQLTEMARIVNLGTIPASGQAMFTFPISASLEAGTFFVAQSEVTLSPSDIRRTNSIPIVVR
jgi:hypothetical protein